MSKVEHIEMFVQDDAPNYGSRYHPAIHVQSQKSTFAEKWMPVISLGCLPLICASLFAVQGSPRVLQWVIRIINSLF